MRGFRGGHEELGRLGEALAARDLRRRGWRVLAARLRTPEAELDLVARDGPCLVCVEVKTGRLRREPGGGGLDLRWRPGLRLDRRTLERIRRAAHRLGSAGRVGADRTRVDLVEVLVDPERGEHRLLHHRDLRLPLVE